MILIKFANQIVPRIRTLDLWKKQSNRNSIEGRDRDAGLMLRHGSMIK